MIGTSAIIAMSILATQPDTPGWQRGDIFEDVNGCRWYMHSAEFDWILANCPPVPCTFGWEEWATMATVCQTGSGCTGVTVKWVSQELVDFNSVGQCKEISRPRGGGCVVWHCFGFDPTLPGDTPPAPCMFGDCPP